MNSIFFPFTSLTQYDADCLLSFFETFSYLTTSSADELALSEPEWFQTLWKEKRAVEPVTLSQEELIPLRASIKSWKDWADTNYGKQTKSGYLQSIFRDSPYFTSDSDIVSIRTQIKSGLDMYSKDTNKNANNALHVKSAPVFLRLAAMADRENEAVDQQLSSIGRLEADVFAELKGGLDEKSFDSNILRVNTATQDRGELMTEQRVRAWFSFFLTKKYDFSDQSHQVFVTTSRAVIDFIISVSEKSKLMLDIDNFKVHKEKNSTANYELFQITEQQMAVILAGLKK